jgi:hypothetical protein
MFCSDLFSAPAPSLRPLYLPPLPRGAVSSPVFIFASWDTWVHCCPAPGCAAHSACPRPAPSIFQGSMTFFMMPSRHCACARHQPLWCDTARTALARATYPACSHPAPGHLRPRGGSSRCSPHATLCTRSPLATGAHTGPPLSPVHGPGARSSPCIAPHGTATAHTDVSAACCCCTDPAPASLPPPHFASLCAPCQPTSVSQSVHGGAA